MVLSVCLSPRVGQMRLPCRRPPSLMNRATTTFLTEARCKSPLVSLVHSPRLVLTPSNCPWSYRWITNSAEADIFLVFANVDPSKGYKGITCFAVEKEMGVVIAKKEKKVGCLYRHQLVLAFSHWESNQLAFNVCDSLVSRLHLRVC